MCALLYAHAGQMTKQTQEIITNEIEISRQMDSKMKSERSVLRNVFVIICLFIPFLMITVLKNAVVYLKRKVYDFFQSKLKKFNDIHRHSTTLQQHTDPAFEPYIKGEYHVPGNGCPKKTTETGKGRRFQKVVQQNNKCTRKIQKNKSTNQKRKQCKIKMQPPPVEELVLKGPTVFSFRQADNSAPTSTPDVPGQVPANINVETLTDDRNVCCWKHTSASQELKRRSGFYFHVLRIVKAIVDVLLFVPQKMYTYVQQELELFNDIHQDSMEVLPYTEPAFIAYLKGEEAAPFIENPHIRFSTSSLKDLPCSPLSPSSLEKEQFIASPTVGQQAQAKSESTTRWKTIGEIMPHSTTPSKNDFATRLSGTEKKAKPKVKSRLISSAPTDVFAPTPAVEEKSKGKSIPSPSRHEIRAPGKAKIQEHSSSGVAHSRQVCSANVTGGFRGIDSRKTDGQLTAKEQILVEPTSARVKQAKNREEFEQISCWYDHAPVAWTQNMLSTSRDVSLNEMVASNITGKRNTERSSHVNLKAAPTEFVAGQARLADTMQSEEVTAKDPQLIEVVNSVLSAERLSTGHPEVMPESDGEPCLVTSSFAELVEAKQQSKIASSIQLMEPMELDQGQCEHGILCGDVQTEAMKTNQECAVPTEEIMETDQEPFLTTPSDVHQLETMSTHKLADASTPLASPFGERDAKKPLSSSVGVNALIAEQALNQSVMKPDTVCMVSDKQCFMQLDTSICNEHPEEMECEPFNNNLNFALIKQQMTTAAETDQLEPEVSNFCDGLDSDSDDDSQAEAYCDLGLAEQVLLIIDLLAWKESFRVMA